MRVDADSYTSGEKTAWGAYEYFWVALVLDTAGNILWSSEDDADFYNTKKTAIKAAKKAKRELERGGY